MDFVAQYHRCLFAQVLLGVLAFCIAQQNPALLLIAGTAAALAWYVTQGPRGKYLPRWAVNLGALAAIAWPIMEMQWRISYLGLAVGHFLMALQIVMLYARRNNREDSALIVLSLLLVIDGAVISDTMIYGLFLIAYGILALPTLLLFHLKITRDEVRAANQAASPEPSRVPPPPAAAGRGHRMQFRTAAAGIGTVCVLFALVVFLLFPRWQPTQTANALTGQFERARTGYSEVLHLGPQAPLPGRGKAVARIHITRDGKNIGSPDKAWKVRGASLPMYDADTHTWRASDLPITGDAIVDVTDQGGDLSALPPDTAQIDAAFILLEPSGSRLFSLEPAHRGMARVVHLHAPALKNATYDVLSGDLSARSAVPPRTRYTLAVPAAIGKLAEPDAQVSAMDKHSRYARGWHTHRAQIRDMDERILKQAGIEGKPHTDDSKQIVRVVKTLADFLRNHFRYTVDNPSTPDGLDPIAAFLFRSRAGHCELFAAGLAAMVRVLDIPARVVTGYRASEYNPYGHYYVVRERDAHAWTEVFCGPSFGWLSFDSTPPDAVAADDAREQYWYTSFRQFYDYLAFRWMGTIAHYDSSARQALIAHFTGSTKDHTGSGSWVNKFVTWIKQLPGRWRLDTLDYSLMAFFFALLLASAAIIARMIVLRRRRMATLQLTSLPPVRRWELGRKLRFYLTMLDMLERHGYKRPSWQSPFSFAQELAEANPGRFDPVVALTELFYEVRFGHRDLDQTRRQRVRIHLRHLEDMLQ